MSLPKIAVFTRRHFAALFLFFLLFRFLSADAYRSAIGEGKEVGMDFMVFHQAAVRLREKKNIYIEEVEGRRHAFFALPGPKKQATGYLYTPLLAFLLYPLSFLGLAPAAKIWIIINILALWGSIICFALTFGYRWREAAAMAVIAFAGFRFWPVVMNFYLGQFNCVILFFFTLFLLATSRRRQRAGGLALAVIILMKTWGVALLLYLILRRQYRAALWCAGGCLAGITVFFSVIGWNQLRDFLFVTKYFSAQAIMLSQSIPGFVRTHFLPNTVLQPWSTNVLLAYSIGAVLMALVAAGFLLACIQRPAASIKENSTVEAGQIEAWQAAFAVACLLLVLPLSHLEYLIFALPLLWLTIVPPRHFKNQIPLTAQIVAVGLYLVLNQDFPVAAATSGLSTLWPSLPGICVFVLWAMHARKLVALNRSAHNDNRRLLRPIA